MNTKHLKEIGQGIECNVYGIEQGLCYKEYSTELNITTIYKAAEQAANAELGPEVFGRDDCGYITEIVDTVHDCDDTEYCDGQCDRCKDLPIDIDKYLDLKTKLADLFGCEIEDLHMGNIGIKNDKIICIDFGIGISG